MTDQIDDGEEPDPKGKNNPAGEAAGKDQPEYAVGYGKPPVGSQFAKGNKKGGRKRARWA